MKANAGEVLSFLAYANTGRDEKKVKHAVAEAKQQLADGLVAALPKANSIAQPDLSGIPDGGHWVHFKGQKYMLSEVEKAIRRYFR